MGLEEIHQGMELWIRRGAAQKPAASEIQALREHIDADHLVMVQLGRLAETAIKMLEHVSMDTGEDRELHARAVGALRDRLGEIAAAMKEANDSAPTAAVREEMPPDVCPKCGTASCLEDKALDF